MYYLAYMNLSIDPKSTNKNKQQQIKNQTTMIQAEYIQVTSIYEHKHM